MRVKRIEQTIIPRTGKGQQFAESYCERLKKRGVYRQAECSLDDITITAEYYLEVKDDEVTEC